MARKIEKNVLEFLKKAEADYAAFKAEDFSQDIYGAIIDGKTESPIEDLFLIAIRIMCEANYVDYWPDPRYTEEGKEVPGIGLFVFPQRRIGKYRADFLLRYERGASVTGADVIVELDGHDFHDKDKRQRSFEKARDRFLVREGYRVLHFTGSDVVADPYEVAHEVLSLMGICLDEYSVTDPFNRGW